MVKYRITCIRMMEQWPVKVTGVYEYPASMNVRKFWLQFCQRNNLKLYSLEQVSD